MCVIVALLLISDCFEGFNRLEKAPEGWRSPKPGGMPDALSVAIASWTAPALWRFFAAQKIGTHNQSPNLAAAPLSLHFLRSSQNRV
jgi:hypothetical protein